MGYKEALFPTWAPLDKREDNSLDQSVRCYMTEIQLQAILDAQGDPDAEINLDMMTTADGREISKFSLEAMTVGIDVSNKLNELFYQFNLRYVGNDSVFPTESTAPKVLTAFKNNPFHFELRDEYTKGPNPKKLPSVRGTYYHGKPATRKIIEHFVRTTPVVSKCDHPRCLSRLVIVPKRDPGTTKSSAPTGYRVTMNAVINGCIKPTASITPLATDEIKKLHHYKYYLQLDGSQAFWSIPLTEESKKLLAFQTHEGIFAWDRLTMGAQPSSSVQQGAYHEALDEYIPWLHRHRFALLADDIAAGAETLEELFELYKMLIECLAKAGIQVKPQKLKFGVREIKFHNYKISRDRTAVKEENLEPIRQMAIPTSVTEVKAFLGCCGQMSAYCQSYAIMAEPLYRLTRKATIFPRPWLPDTDYDIAFHMIKGMMLDTPLFLWNKVSTRRLFIEVDSSQEGWGACVYQYAEDPPAGVEDEGRFRLLDKPSVGPVSKRIIAWISKAHTPYEQKLPCFYRETLARLLTLEHFRNLIETQHKGAGTTVYTDHLPAVQETSLSNKGQLSTWRIHETADLNSIVQTLHRSGITMEISDPLSRINRTGDGMNMVILPLVLDELLTRLPPEVKNYKYLRVSAERDTAAAARIVQRWRNPTNPISVLRPEATGNYELLIAATFADKCTHRAADLFRKSKPFAFLIPTTLIREVPRTAEGKTDKTVLDRLEKSTKIVMSAIGHTWLINLPNVRLEQTNYVLYSEDETVDYPHVYYNKDENLHLDPHLMVGVKEEALLIEALYKVDVLLKDGASRKPNTSDLPECLAQTRSSLNLNQSSSVDDEVTRSHKISRPKGKVRFAPREDTDMCLPCEPKQTLTKVCTKHKPVPTAFNKIPAPRPFTEWIGQQPTPGAADKMILVDTPPGYPEGLQVYKDENGNIRIPVPAKDRIVLINQCHATHLHVKGQRVNRQLAITYWWPTVQYRGKKLTMEDFIKVVCSACRQCQLAQIRRNHLAAQFTPKNLPLPRQQYGLDFYGHEQGNILVAIDLCTREVTLWFLKNRDQHSVVRCLLQGLIFQKGVPMGFRSDAAKEFVHGTVEALNLYLGIEHISTGGYNARANAVVERFMQTLNSMLRTCDDKTYKDIKNFLPAIAFAHNTTYNSVLEATPFECGHGLRARTVSDARMSPRLQFRTEEGRDNEDILDKWEATTSRLVLETATRLLVVAQRNSEWHRRMTSERLNQANRPVSKQEIPEGSQVYFYKPPSQLEAKTNGRMVKHLHYYRGPATIKGRSKDRARNYEIEYKDKKGKVSLFYRDEGMIVPAREMPKPEDITDPSDLPSPNPAMHDPENVLPLTEGELIITRDDPTSTEWYVAEIHRVLPDKIVVKYFSTRTPSLDDYSGQTQEAIEKRLKQVHFRRTWYFRSGKNAGKGTVNPPFPNNPELRTWNGPLPKSELSGALLIRGLGLTGAGKLTRESLRLAAQLKIPHAVTPTVEDEVPPVTTESLLTLDAPYFFEVTTATACYCTSCLAPTDCPS